MYDAADYMISPPEDEEFDAEGAESEFNLSKSSLTIENSEVIKSES